VVAIRLGGNRQQGETMRVPAAAAMIAVDVMATAVATMGEVIGTNLWRRPERVSD
jgi:hypothetical protein